MNTEQMTVEQQIIDFMAGNFGCEYTVVDSTYTEIYTMNFNSRCKKWKFRLSLSNLDYFTLRDSKVKIHEINFMIFIIPSYMDISSPQYSFWNEYQTINFSDPDNIEFNLRFVNHYCKQTGEPRNQEFTTPMYLNEFDRDQKFQCPEREMFRKWKDLTPEEIIERRRDTLCGLQDTFQKRRVSIKSAAN